MGRLSCESWGLDEDPISCVNSGTDESEDRGGAVDQAAELEVSSPSLPTEVEDVARDKGREEAALTWWKLDDGGRGGKITSAGTG